MIAPAPYAVPAPAHTEFFDTQEQAMLYAVSIGAEVHRLVDIDGSAAYYERVGVTTSSTRTVFCVRVDDTADEQEVHNTKP
jgi:hypothetical protein